MMFDLSAEIKDKEFRNKYSVMRSGNNVGIYKKTDFGWKWIKWLNPKEKNMCIENNIHIDDSVDNKTNTNVELVYHYYHNSFSNLSVNIYNDKLTFSEDFFDLDTALKVENILTEILSKDKVTVTESNIVED